MKKYLLFILLMCACGIVTMPMSAATASQGEAVSLHEFMQARHVKASSQTGTQLTQEVPSYYREVNKIVAADVYDLCADGTLSTSGRAFSAFAKVTPGLGLDSYVVSDFYGGSMLSFSYDSTAGTVLLDTCYSTRLIHGFLSVANQSFYVLPEEDVLAGARTLY